MNFEDTRAWSWEGINAKSIFAFLKKVSFEVELEKEWTESK